MNNHSESERITLLQRMPVFGGIRSDTLQFLLERTRDVEVPAGEYFYHEGDAASSLFVLEFGRVLLLKRWEKHDYLLKTLQRGNSFGEVALIDLMPRNTSTWVAEDSCAIELSDKDLYHLYEWDREQFTLIHMNMAREVCRRLREADERMFVADMKTRKFNRVPVKLSHVS